MAYKMIRTTLRKDQYPADSMEKDIDRLCLENAVARFLHSGKKKMRLTYIFAI